MDDDIVTPLSKIEVRTDEERRLVELAIDGVEANMAVELSAKQAKRLGAILLNAGVKLDG